MWWQKWRFGDFSELRQLFNILLALFQRSDYFFETKHIFQWLIMVALFLNQDHSHFFVITILSIGPLFDNINTTSDRDIYFFTRFQFFPSGRSRFLSKIKITLFTQSRFRAHFYFQRRRRDFWFYGGFWDQGDIFLRSRSGHLLSFSLSIGLFKFFEGGFLGFDQPLTLKNQTPFKHSHTYLN